jgi:hypothetical protein
MVKVGKRVEKEAEKGEKERSSEGERKKKNQFLIFFTPSKSAPIGVQNKLFSNGQSAKCSWHTYFQMDRQAPNMAFLTQV